MPNKVLTIVVPSNPIEVIQLKVPGQQGPGGVPGPPGPGNALSIGTVSSLAEGASATATISGVSPTQTLNLGIPRGATGAPGPPSNLTIGTITTSAPGGNGAATITGTAPNYTLNLTLPRGYGVPSSGTASQLLVKNSSTDYDTGWLSYTDAATASTVVLRNSSGNFSANLIAGSAAPTTASHLTRKDYVDAIGVTTETPSTIVRRDASGDIYATDVYVSAAPTVAAQLTRKDYVDGQVATRAPTSHTHTASQISDSTTTGRSVLTATDGPAARSAIGAGTGNSNLALGTTSSTAKAGDYQPTAANISDSTATGRSVLTAADGAAARTAIGAGTSSLVIGTTSTTAKAGDYAPPAATEAVSGISRFATAAETATGTANGISVHPAGLASFAAAFGRDRGTGTTFPNTDLRRGDVYYHTTLRALFTYTGASWDQVEDIQGTEAQIKAISTGLLVNGMTAYSTDTKSQARWDGNRWLWWDTFYQTYTPLISTGAITNYATDGNANKFGQYLRRGREVYCRGFYQLGSTTAYNSGNFGTLFITYPAGLMPHLTTISNYWYQRGASQITNGTGTTTAALLHTYSTTPSSRRMVGASVTAPAVYVSGQNGTYGVNASGHWIGWETDYYTDYES